MCNFFGLLPGPKTPDPIKTAQAQNSINAEAIANSARYNRTNQATPFGNLTYSGTPGAAEDTVTTTLSPELQRLLTGQTAISQGLTDQANTRLGQIPTTAFSLAGAPGVRSAEGANIQDSFGMGGPIQYDIGDAGAIQRSVDLSGQPSLSTDFESQLNSSRDAAYNSQAQYLDPRFAREQQAMESQLAAQGIPVGSEAYKNAMAQFGETKNQAYQGAQNAATLAGNSLQNQLFGQNLSARQQGVGEQFGLGEFGNSAQQQFFSQLAAKQQANNAAAGQEFGQNMSAADFANQANMARFDQGQVLRGNDIQDRERSINENLLERNQGFNELAAFLNGSPIAPNSPAFANTPVYNAAQGSPDATGLAASNYAAKRQASAGMLGSLFGAAGQVGAAALAACWVAREVYGIENPKWLQFREWLFAKAPRWFRALYLTHGARFAVWLHDKPRLKAVIRRWMDARIEHA